MSDRLFRVYEPGECGKDGYPFVWHALAPGEPGVKDCVRKAAGDRCVRCGHPYSPGCGTWGGHWEGDPPFQEPSEQEEALRGRVEQMRLLEGMTPDRLSDVVKQPSRPPLWSPCDEQCTHQDDCRGQLYPRIPSPWQAIRFTPQYPTAGVWARHMPVQAAWRILTTHHLNERKFDLRWWNLVALCQRCHLNVQRRVKMDRVYPWPHSEWFHPYVAAFYAYTLLGEDLSREQAMSRLDELLALGQMAARVERMAL